MSRYAAFLCGGDERETHYPCPEGGGEHIIGPEGYVDRAIWAEKKLKTHRNKRCDACRKYFVWEVQ